MVKRQAREAANDEREETSSTRQRQPSRRRVSIFKNVEKSILEEFKKLLTELVSYLASARQESASLHINNMSKCIDAVLSEARLIMKRINNTIRNYESTEDDNDSDEEEENGECPWEWFRSQFRKIKEVAKVNQNVAYRFISLQFIILFNLFCSAFPTLSCTYSRDLNAVSFDAEDYQCNAREHGNHRPIHFNADFARSFHFGRGMMNDPDLIPFFRQYFREMRTSENEDERSWFQNVHDNNAIYIFQCKLCTPENHYKPFYVGYTTTLKTRLRNHRSSIKHCLQKTLPKHVFCDVHRVTREHDRDVLQKYFNIFVPVTIVNLDQNIWRCQEVFYQWLFEPEFVMNQR